MHRSSLTNRFDLRRRAELDFFRAGGDRDGGGGSVGPADLNGGGRFGVAKHCNGAVLGPIPAAGMKLSHRTGPWPEHQPQLRSEERRVGKEWRTRWSPYH